MFNLVWKDFLILKRYLWISLFYGFFAVLAFNFMNGGALSAATVGVTYMLMAQSIAMDDKNKSEIMLNSLPLRRRDIVFAKYLSVFLYATLGILSFLLAQCVVTVIGISIPISHITIEGIFGALIATVVLLSIYYPIYFKFGYLRSRWAGMILFFACFFFLPLAGDLIVNGLGGVNPALQNIAASLQRVDGWLQAQADWQIASYLLVLAFIFVFASVRLSLSLYTRREF